MRTESTSTGIGKTAIGSKRSISMRAWLVGVLRIFWLPVVAIYLLTVFFRMPGLKGWDEAFYLTQMSSVILDGDLMLQNDLLDFPNDIDIRIRTVSVLRPDGVLINAFSIGPAVFYGMVMAPAYAAGIERFDIGFRRVASVWAGLFLILGFIALDRILQLFGMEPFSRYLAILAATFSTPFIEYGFKFYITSHFPAAIATIFTILFSMLWLREPKHVYAWAAGLASGWLMITRWQGSVFLICFVIPVILVLRSGTDKRKRYGGIFIAASLAALVLAIQCTVWKLHYGGWLSRPVDENFMNWSTPNLFPFLLSGYHGLLSWSPGILVGWLGLLLMGVQTRNAINRWLIWGFAAGILLQVYVCASTWDWWGGSSYGPRRMTFLLTPIAVGWAYLLTKLPRVVSVFVTVAAIAWGLFTLCAFFEGVDDLTLLLTGKPDMYRPASSEVTDEMIASRWQHWKNGYDKRLRSDFRLVDKSRVRYRRQGTLVIAAMVFTGAFLAGRMRRSARARIVVLSGITFYLIVVLGFMLIVIPSNEPWHAHWAAVIRKQPEPSISGMKQPEGYELASRFIYTYNQISSRDGRSFLDPDKIYTEGFSGMTLKELSDYALN